MEYTPEQKEVIETRNRNILVSAAAGSGKTAVLVERILQRITDPDSPLDVDRLLVVTFTNAAAAQMKERIRLALESRLDETPEDENLLRQRSLISTAQITTIHSFCQTVIRDHFNRIGMDPRFRIGDEPETALLREEAMEHVMDRAYEEGGPAFYRLLEHYSRKRDDSDIREQIFSLYEYSLGKSDPEDWLTRTVKAYEREGDDRGFFWEGELTEYVIARVKELAGACDRLLSLCELPAGPYFYAERIQEEKEALEACSGSASFEILSERLEGLSFRTLPSKRDDSVDTDLKERVKALRTEIKKQIKALQEKFCFRPLKEEYDDIASCREFTEELVRLCLSFREEFCSMKEERRLVDFSDLEHRCLAVLRSGADEAYRSFFREVMVDEYQDVSPVQEAILKCIAPERGLFSVGDVKQSIYGFRLADPSIFLARYDRYQQEEESTKIDLKKNFRSRHEVLDAVNAVFEKVMRRERGGVDYDDSQRLYPGAGYRNNGRDYTAELNLYQNDPDTGLSDAELEARAVVNRIRELVRTETVEENEKERPLRYDDIAVLLRSFSGAEEAFETAFAEAGIPVQLQSHTGYFQTAEIRTMISFLTVIDNPRQDIPLMAVLKSVFGGFDDYELSLIRCADPEGQLFDALKASAGDATSPVGKRAEQFLRTLEHYRDMTLDRPIHEIIECIMEDFHYDLAAGAGGEGAVMNLRLLIRKAADFEETSYRGLFHFIRYLEQLKKYEYDPEDGVQEGDENAVHVMSIHRSKGLEFPVVFLCALQKRFNLKDAASAMVTDSTLGIGIDRFDPDWSLQWPTLLKSLISARRVLLSKSEELRVLYVAMTRAKERLIMSGVVKDAEKSAGKDLVDPSYASSFLEVLLFVIDPEQKDFPICLKNVSLEELALTEAAEQFREEERSLAVQELFSAEPETQEPDEETRRLEKQLFWKDLREDINRIPAKTAVTSFTERFDPEDERKLRMLQAEEDEASSGQDVAKTRGEAGKKNSAGALRGLAYHKALELVDIKSIQSAPQAEAYLASLVQTGILEAAAAKMVNPEDIAVYCKTALAGRMGKAAQEGRLSREQPFIISRSARILDDSFPEDQEILIQGIIDAFFYEDDGIVVVDYKTDHVDREEVLKQRYAEQLAFYASALEQLTGKRVKEKIIYSVFLGKEIPL